MQLSYFSLSYFVYAAFLFHFPISHFPISYTQLSHFTFPFLTFLFRIPVRSFPISLSYFSRERFILRLHIAVATPRCVICTPGCPHAAAPAHTSSTSRTRKIKDEELLKSAAHDAPVDCSPVPVRRARHPDASDSGRTGRYVAADVQYAPRAARMPQHQLTPRPLRGRGKARTRHC